MRHSRLPRAVLFCFASVQLWAQADPEDSMTISSLAGVKWTLESALSLPNTTSSVPSILMLPNGDIRMYFCGGPAGMLSATSRDGGKSFTPDAGSRVMGTCDGTFIYLANGQFRFLAQDLGSGQTQVKFISYLTSDGLTFTKENGVRYAGSPNDFNSVNVPSVIKLPDGKHRMYYVGDINPAPPEGNTIRTALSSDEGVTWTPENGGKRLEDLVPRGLELQTHDVLTSALWHARRRRSRDGWAGWCRDTWPRPGNLRSSGSRSRSRNRGGLGNGRRNHDEPGFEVHLVFGKRPSDHHLVPAYLELSIRAQRRL